ncbi:VENN motif pre-toxin domain-containing protein [Utexia brackfieldae]|uniref:VENN motif pre-toxin domain-containing protein n=1 Tax=Utexia brackfieldae TaxID=3074108 RepID=UPI00370DE2A2
MAQNDLADKKDTIIKDAEDKFANMSDDEKRRYGSAENYANQTYYNAVSQQVSDNARKNIGGIGSSVNKGIDAATSVITGLLTGNIAGGLAGASAPYLAEQIKLHTGHQERDGRWTMDDPNVNLVAHAILGAVVAQLQGNSALAGAVGAAGGELIANQIRETLYGNRKVEDLTESEKQNISNLAQLAAGLGTTLASGGDMGDTGAAVSVTKNAVENNYLSAGEDKQRKDAEDQLALIEKGTMVVSDEEKRILESKVALLNGLDAYTNEVLAKACQNLSSVECSTEKDKLKEVYQSYFNTISPKDVVAYNDAYNTYAQYYDGYKDIEALTFGLDIAQAQVDRDILAQRISKNWDVDKATADKIVLGMRISNDVFGLAAAVVGSKVVNEVGTAPKVSNNTSAGKATTGGSAIGDGTSAGKGASGQTGNTLEWNSWQNYQKTTIDGKQYAQVGDRLYSQHAVDRMQPSGLGSPAGTAGAGRNISPGIVEYTIQNGTKTNSTVNGVERTVHWSGDVGVVTENNGKVIVTILRRSEK